MAGCAAQATEVRAGIYCSLECHAGEDAQHLCGGADHDEAILDAEAVAAR